MQRNVGPNIIVTDFIKEVHENLGVLYQLEVWIKSFESSSSLYINEHENEKSNKKKGEKQDFKNENIGVKSLEEISRKILSK